MISKIKSRKIAITKILLGFVLAFSLVSAFAFENHDATKSNLNSAEQKEKVYLKVEQMPKYQGGEQELVNFLVKSIVYPEEAKKKGIQGKVFVEFVVGKDGAIKDVKIAKSADPLLDAEAIRVVKSMPKWVPGMEKGKQVAVQYTIPIKFALE